MRWTGVLSGEVVEGGRAPSRTSTVDSSSKAIAEGSRIMGSFFKGSSTFFTVAPRVPCILDFFLFIFFGVAFVHRGAKGTGV